MANDVVITAILGLSDRMISILLPMSYGSIAVSAFVMGEICRLILAALKVDAPRQIDDLLESCDTCSSSEIIAGLFELEMAGFIRQLPGKNFVKVWADQHRSQ